MTMFSAKVDIGSSRSSSRSRSSEPRIVSAPQRIGSSAATTLRNTQSASRNRIGKAIFSARVRSCWIWSLTCTVASAVPPTAVPGTALEPRGDTLRRPAPQPLRDPGPRVGGDDRLAPVAREERRRERREDRLRPDDPDDPREALPGGIAHEDEELRGCRQAAGALDRRLGPQALAALGDEVVRGPAEEAGRLPAERGRDDGEHAGDREHGARPAHDEVGEPFHPEPFCSRAGTT